MHPGEQLTTRRLGLGLGSAFDDDVVLVLELARGERNAGAGVDVLRWHVIGAAGAMTWGVGCGEVQSSQSARERESEMRDVFNVPMGVC